MSTNETKTHTVDPVALVSACLDAAIRAGETIRSVYQRGGYSTYTDKSDGSQFSGPAESNPDYDPQTEADTSAQKFIVASLSRAFPRLKIVGEEGELAYSADTAQDLSLTRCRDGLVSQNDALQRLNQLEPLDIQRVCVWVDPLDGTREFTKGIVNAVTTLVGISVDGDAYAGIIVVPFTEKYIWGIKGIGAFGTVEPIYNSTNHPHKHDTVLCTSRSHMTPLLASRIESMGVKDMIRVGGAGNKGILLISGEANVYAYPREGTKRWDVCAVQAVLEAQGGRLTDAYGEPIKYIVPPQLPLLDSTTGESKSESQEIITQWEDTVGNKHGVLATLGIEHEKFVLSPSTTELKPHQQQQQE